MNALRLVCPGLAYFAAVFVLGFALGAIRTLFLEPALGDLRAVLLELPFMLAAAWIICSMIMRRLAPTPGLLQRGMVGAVAFACLIAAEIVLARLLSGIDPAGVIASWATPAGAAGLGGQIAFAIFPLMVKAGRRHPSI